MHTHTSKLRFYDGHQHSLAAAAMNWLLTNTVGTTTVATAATPSAFEPDWPSPSSPAFSAAGQGANKDRTDSGRSSPSVSSSSSAADTFSFSTSGQRSASTSTSALCFGAGGGGVRLCTSSKALARASSKIHGEEEDAQAAAAAKVAPKGFAVGRHLRRISRRLRKKARAGDKETPPAAPPRGGGVDDTAREPTEAVASAIAHCKKTLCRGMPMPRRRLLPPPLSSLSLDLWLRDRQDEIIASAARQCGDGDSRRPTPATALARHAPCMRLPLPHIARPAAPPGPATGEPASQISGLASKGTEMRGGGGFSELEFLETFDGDDELIDRHFITVQI